MKRVFTTPSCKACKLLIKEYELEGMLEGQDFEKIEIGKDITIEEFKTLYPSVRSVPFVVE